MVAFLGNGATIRADHVLVVWTEGREDQPAAESYDHVAEVVNQRLVEFRKAADTKRKAAQAAYKCAGPSCPGYSFRASDRPHPASRANPTTPTVKLEG